MLELHPYNESYQSDIDAMIMDIASEFELPISSGFRSLPQAIDKYWVAFDSNTIIGTIAVLKIGNNNVILKNMFVKKEYRGSNYGTAQLLLNTVVDWCHSVGRNTLYLGTMSQFKAAHKFYKKNGFESICKSRLPASFIVNPVDDVFYSKAL